VALCALLTLGLGLTYYGALLMFLAFMAAELVTLASTAGIAEALRRIRWVALAITPIALILLLRLRSSVDAGILGQAAAAGLVDDAAFALQATWSRSDWLLWLPATVGCGLAFMTKHRNLRVCAAWLVALLLFNVAQISFGITVSSLLNTLIFLALPLTLFAGFAYRVVLVFGFRDARTLAFILTLVLALTGAYYCSGISQPSVVFYRPTDAKAMEWIKHNAPESSVFLIDSFWWGDSLAPSNGGGWLPAIAARKVILFDPQNDEMTLESGQVDFVYAGGGYGNMSPKAITASRAFSLVYDVEGTQIYARVPIGQR
jgi:hypothetical protein